MKKSSFLCVLMAAALMSGCSKSELVTPSAGIEPGEIVLRSSVTDVTTAPSRAAFEGSVIDADHPLRARVFTRTTGADYANPYCDGTMTFMGLDAATYNKPVLSGNYLFDITGPSYTINHYLTGLAPADGWTGSGPYEFEVTGKEDVMLATEKTTTYQNVYTNTTYATLAFTHQLTLLKLKFIIAEEDQDITVNSVKVTGANGGLKTKAVATISGTQTVAFEGEADELPCYLYNTDEPLEGKEYTVGETGEVYAYVLVPPVTADDQENRNEYKFYIAYTEGGETTDQEVGVDLYTDADGEDLLIGSTAGYANEITFKFLPARPIKATASVTPWNSTGKKEYDL